MNQEFTETGYYVRAQEYVSDAGGYVGDAGGYVSDASGYVSDVKCEDGMKNGESESKEDTPALEEAKDQDVEALSNNRVGVEIEPDVKSNRVYLQICSCSFILNCFSLNK